MLKEYTPGFLTSFQIGRGSHVLKVVHVDDIDDGRHHPRLVLNGSKREKIVKDMREHEGEGTAWAFRHTGSHIPVPRVSQTC